jgi:DNA modification methylase
MTVPYYNDEQVTLYHGDCREITEWLEADVLVTDPPYGRKYQPRNDPRRGVIYNPAMIAGDENTDARDSALGMWEIRPGVVFGDLMLAPAPGTKKVLVYRKPVDAGAHGSINGWRHDLEAVYLTGPWPATFGGRSSLLISGARSQGNPYACAGRYGHPHAKPVDVMETLIAVCPFGVISDPFAGSGSTLVAARNLGRRAIGVEIEERYCEIAARRLAQGVMIA